MSTLLQKQDQMTRSRMHLVGLRNAFLLESFSYSETSWSISELLLITGIFLANMVAFHKT